MTRSIKDLFEYSLLKLRSYYPVDESRAIADRLFEHYCNLSPVQRVMSGLIAVDAEKVSLLEAAIDKLSENYPLQYIIGKTWFLDLEFIVNESVLIPRPETEELVMLILNKAAEIRLGNLSIIDIGTGSGCIAITLKHYLPGAKVTAIDISEAALEVASANAEKNNVEINFIKSDVLDPSQWGLLPEADIIVSNPPYVTLSEKTLMHSNVLDHEPHSALFVPDEDPLRFYKAIAYIAKNKLSGNGQLWFEINESFGSEVVSLFGNDLYQERLLLKDMFGKYRFVKVTK